LIKFLPLVFHSLRRNLRRTILTTLSISISIFVFAASISLPETANEILRDKVSTVRVLCHAKGGIDYLLPAAHRRAIETTIHVAAVTGYMDFDTSYRDPGVHVEAVAVDPDRFAGVLPEWATASAAAALQHERSACLATPRLMKRYGWKVGDKIILRSIEGDLELTIEGALTREETDEFIVFRRDYLTVLPTDSGKVIFYWIKVDRSESIPGVIKAIDSRFANSSFPTTSESEASFAAWQLRGYRSLMTVAEFLAAIVILMIGLVAANTAAMTVRERRNDIAVMRAIGYPRRVVVGVFMGEGTAIGLIAGVIGCILAWGLLDLMPMLMGDAAPIKGISFLPRVIMESLGIAVLIGLTSAAIPAFLASGRALLAELRAV
jgi:putative ABC transport system permease protein